MYKFTNKTDGSIKFGNLTLAGVGYDEFTCDDGTVIRVENPNMDGTNLSCTDYDVEYTGEVPTPAAEAVNSEDAQEVVTETVSETPVETTVEEVTEPVAEATTVEATEIPA